MDKKDFNLELFVMLDENNQGLIKYIEWFELCE